ncbi:HAD family hydrolase [Desulfoluna spongiiphila]|uniref:HAD family hydrolase n=1 Tax=Desulfoluna spongiiphila TaxID=419481 RepID=UPI001250DB20|nr:HAD family hydrolase [Desulfoluna spongiiphila]VVS95607.1 c1.5: had beta-pgm phosphatase like [Desulfoluna spongiiphila]
MTLVVFDLGETLVSYEGIPLNWSEHYLDAINDFLIKNSFCVPTPDLELAVSILEFYNTRTNQRIFEVEEGEVTRKIATVLGIDGAAFERSFFSYFQRRAVVEDSAVTILTELKNAGVFTAVLSDVPYGMPRDFLLDDLGPLVPLMDRVVSSCEVGVRKPHPLGLITLMTEFGSDPGHVFYVGNEEKDMDCAANAGARSILLAPGETVDYGQTYSIQTLSGVLNHML